METKSTRFLTVTPESLILEGPYDQPKFTKFAIYNANGCNLVFKIKSTCPDDISAAPNIGFLKPYERIEVLVTLAGNCFDPTIRNREKFLIQSAVTSVPCTDWATTNPKEIIRNVPKPEEVKLTIRFLPPKPFKAEEEEIVPKTENPTLPLESKTQQQNAGLAVPQTTFFLKNDGTYTQGKELEEDMKKHEKAKITGALEQQNAFFMTPEIAKQMEEEKKQKEEEKKRNERQKISGMLDQQSTFFVKGDGSYLPYSSKNTRDENQNQETQNTGLDEPQKTFFVKGDGTSDPSLPPPKNFERNKSSPEIKKKQQENYFIANEDGTCSVAPIKNSGDEMTPAKSSKPPSEPQKKHQNTGTKAKIFKNGYQSSDEDGDDESETTKEKIKPSRECKNNFDVPEKAMQAPIKDVTETTGQNKPNSSEKTLSQKPTTIDENNNTNPKSKIEVPKQTVPSENTTTWDWVKDMTRKIKELGDRMTAMEEKIKEPTQIPKDLISGVKELLDRMSALEAKVKENTKTTLVSHDLTMNIRELRNCINTMDAKGKHEFQDVTSNIKELRDRVTALEAKQKEPPKRADEKKDDSDNDNTNRQTMNNEIQGNNANSATVATSTDISPHEIQSKNHLELGVLMVVALFLAFALGRENAIGKAV